MTADPATLVTGNTYPVREQEETEAQASECLECQHRSRRRVPLDEGSDTQTAVDECPRCGGYDVRPLPEDDEPAEGA